VDAANLKVVNLRSGYGSLTVIDGISVHADAGEIVALIGANGAGKSTLLKTVAGLVPHSSGRIFFQGREISRLPAEARASLGLALVPEGRGLFPGMSVEENLALGGHARRLTRAQLRQRVEHVCGLFPVLSERMTAKAGQLSGGQQQALALARAMVGQPDVLLLDEPSTGLAPLVIQEVFTQIRQLKAAGVTIMLAEQNVREALLMADRAYVMKTGRVVLEGSGQSLIQSPEVQKAYLGL
jgi:branched-chain amino acid transport system ATP-binding protein